jgi:hypothetical protein
MRNLKMLSLVAVAMLVAIACARYGFGGPGRNFTW